MPASEPDYRFLFGRNIAVFPTQRFRFAGTEYICKRMGTREDSDGGAYKFVRAIRAMEPSGDAPDMDHCCLPDPRFLHRWCDDEVAQLTRQASGRVPSERLFPDTSETLRGYVPEIMRNIAAHSEEVALQDGDAAMVPSRPDLRLAAFYNSQLGEAWSGGREKPAPANHDRRALTAEERLFMLRNAGRIEGELRWLKANDARVHQCYAEAKRANLSETTAAEMAVICLAREIEDLRAKLARIGAQNGAGPFISAIEGATGQERHGA